jgi:hypothetical protein
LREQGGETGLLTHEGEKEEKGVPLEAVNSQMWKTEARGWGSSSVVEHLISMHEVLGTMPSCE